MTRLRAVPLTAQRVLRCCDTSRSTIVRFSEDEDIATDFGSPRGQGSRKRGAIGMRAKGRVDHVVRR